MDVSLDDLVLLALNTVSDDEGHVSRVRSVPGLCDLLAVDPGAVGRRIELLSALSELEASGFVEGQPVEIDGHSGKRNAYTLTDCGRERAATLRSELVDDPPILSVHTSDGSTVRRAATDLNEYFDRAPLVQGLARATDQGQLQPDTGIEEGLVGRSLELATIRSVPEINETTIIVRGQAGVGKTELVETATQRLRNDGVETLLGRCRPGSDRSYQPFRDAIGTFPTPSGAGDLEDVSTGDSDTFEQERQSLFVSVYDRLLDLADDSHLVLVLEDLHWADDASLELLASLVERLDPGEEISFVCTYRTAELDRAVLYGDFDPTEDERARVVDLDPFDPETTRAFVEMLLGTRAVPESFVQSIHDRTGGHPLFVEEIVTHLRETGAIEPDYDVFPDDIDREAVPETVGRSVDRRLEPLDDETWSVLAAAGVIGSPAPIDSLNAVVDQSEAVLRKRLDLLVGGNFLRYVDEESVAFPSEVLRERVLTTLEPEQARTLHERVADAMEQADDPDHEAIATHYEQSGWPADAVEHLLEAGEEAMGLYAPSVAIDRYQRAAALARDVDADEFDREEPVVEALERIASTQLLSGNYDEADRYFSYVADRTDDLDRQLLAFSLRADMEIDRGRPAQAQSLAESGIEEWNGQPSEGAFHLFSARGNALLKQGDLTAATSVFEQALEVSRAVGDRTVVEQAVHDLGTAALYRGEHDTAIELFESIIDGDHEEGWTVDPVLNNLASLYWRQGDLERAQELFERALERARELGNRIGETVKLFNLGVVAFDRGEWDRAVEHYERTIDQATALELTSEIAFSKCYLGAVSLHRGAVDRARTLLDESVDTFQDSGLRTAEYYARRTRAELYFVTGDLDAATADANAVLDIAERMDAPGKAVPGNEWRGRIALERGDVAAAIEAFEAALDAADAADEREVISARAGSAVARAAAGRHEQAIEMATEARENACRTGIQTVLFRTARAVARSHASTPAEGTGADSHPEEPLEDARTVLRDARTRAEDVGSELERARIEYELGRVEACAGNDDDADDHFDRAASIAAELGFDRLAAAADQNK